MSTKEAGGRFGTAKLLRGRAKVGMYVLMLGVVGAGIVYWLLTFGSTFLVLGQVASFDDPGTATFQADEPSYLILLDFAGERGSNTFGEAERAEGSCDVILADGSRAEVEGLPQYARFGNTFGRSFGTFDATPGEVSISCDVGPGLTDLLPFGDGRNIDWRVHPVDRGLLDLIQMVILIIGAVIGVGALLLLSGFFGKARRKNLEGIAPGFGAASDRLQAYQQGALPGQPNAAGGLSGPLLDGDPALAPIEGVTFDAYVAVTRAVHQAGLTGDSPRADAIAQQHGVPAGQWPRIEHEWGTRVAYDVRLRERYTAAFI